MNVRSDHSYLYVFCLSAIGGVLLASVGPANVLAQSSAGIEVQECVVRFADEVDVPAIETGRVAEVHVRANSAVVPGAPIAKLDDRTLMIRRKAAAVKLQAAEAEADDEVERKFAETALAEAEAELDLNRDIQKGVSGSITRQRMTQLRLAVERGQLEVARAIKREKQAQVELSLRQAEAAVLDDQLRNLHCDSPIAGIVLEVTRSAGEWIEKGAPIATVARIDRLHVHALLSSRQIAPIDCQDLSVSVHWNDPGSGEKRMLQGRVLSVDPQMLPGERFRLHAEIINRTEPKNSSQWQLKPGTEVRMLVHRESPPQQAKTIPVFESR